MERKDAFPLEVRQASNSAIAVLTLQTGSMPQSFEWYGKIGRTVRGCEENVAELQELFGERYSEVLDSYMSLEQCGNCQFFDTKKVDKSPVGEVKVGDEIVPLGYCRTLNGLVLGAMQVNQRCRQPVGTFLVKPEYSSVANVVKAVR